jgi:hypothetical protein
MTLSELQKTMLAGQQHLANTNATPVTKQIVIPSVITSQNVKPAVMSKEAVNTMIQGIQHLNETAVTPIPIPTILQNQNKPDEFVVIPKETIILPAQPEQFIFESGGLNAATKPAPYIEPIKPVYAEPKLDIPDIVLPAIEQPMPKIAGSSELVADSQAIEGTKVNLNPIKKIGIFDQLTNFIYKIIFKK